MSVSTDAQEKIDMPSRRPLNQGMSRIVPALLLIVLGCADDPAAAWVGSYDVTIFESDTPCAGGATVDAPEQNVVWSIERSGSGIVVNNAMCPIRAALETSTRARFEPDSCRVVLDGSSGSIEIISGTLERAASTRISGTLNVRVSLDDGRCAVGTSDLLLAPR